MYKFSVSNSCDFPCSELLLSLICVRSRLLHHSEKCQDVFSVAVSLLPGHLLWTFTTPHTCRILTGTPSHICSISLATLNRHGSSQVKPCAQQTLKGLEPGHKPWLGTSHGPSSNQNSSFRRKSTPLELVSSCSRAPGLSGAMQDVVPVLPTLMQWTLYPVVFISSVSFPPSGILQHS